MKWNKPKVTTISENQLKKVIVAGACSPFDLCTGGFYAPQAIKK